jgi:hypothetical protein
MTDKTERLSVELNDAFARLEKAQDSPDSKKHSDDGSFEGKSGKGRRSKKIAQPTASGSGSILGVLTGLIAIGIASYSAFHTYQLINNPPSAAIIAEVDLRIEDLRRELELSIQASETARSDVRNQLEELSGIQQISARQFKERLDRSLASIRNDMGTSSED